MAILLDPPMWPAHGTLWSHLVSDTSLAELHAFAVAAGVPARSFDLDHYDVPASRHAELLALGAHDVTGRDLLRRLAAGGLRRPERRRVADDVWLRAHWASLAPGAAGGDGGSRARTDAGAELLDRWSEKGRLHHGRDHLREVVDAVTALAAAEEADARTTRVALLAAWFHDAVHVSGRRREAALAAASAQAAAETDEEASAALVTVLLPDDPDAAEVARLVRLTATHEVDPGDLAGSLLSDADLAVLGADPGRYADYAAAIRGEYAHVPEADFRRGRAAVLAPLLAGPLFRTATGRQRWDAAARANLIAEIAVLTSD